MIRLYFPLDAVRVSDYGSPSGANAGFRVKVVGGANCNHSYLRVNYLRDNAVYLRQLTITSSHPAPALDICTVDKILGLTLFPIQGALPRCVIEYHRSPYYIMIAHTVRKKIINMRKEYCETF